MLSGWKMARVTRTWRRETAHWLGVEQSAVERMTETLRPAARQVGGTEGDCLALLHHVALISRATDCDVDQILEDTLEAWSSGRLVGVTGYPLRGFIADPTQAQALTIGAIRLAVPAAFGRWADDQTT